MKESHLLRKKSSGKKEGKKGEGNVLHVAGRLWRAFKRGQSRQVSMSDRLATDPDEAFGVNVSASTRSRQRHHLPQRRFRLAFPRIAFHHATLTASAFEARPGSGSNQFTEPVEFAFDFASFHLDLIAILDAVAQLDVEALRDAGQRGEGARVVAVIARVPGDVVRHLTDGALVARATESGDALLQAAGDGRRARLLQADDVAAEAEAEVAVVVARNLLGRDVHLAVKEARAGRDVGFLHVGRRGGRSRARRRFQIGRVHAAGAQRNLGDGDGRGAGLGRFGCCCRCHCRCRWVTGGDGFGCG